MNKASIWELQKLISFFLQEECRSGMHKRETHLDIRETEKSELQMEVTRLGQAIQKAEVPENPYTEHVEHHEVDTPPTPYPEQGYPNYIKLEEKQQQQQEEQRQGEGKERKRQIVKQKIQVDNLKQQELQRYQEELERKQKAHRQQEAERQQDEQRQQAELIQQQEE